MFHRKPRQPVIQGKQRIWIGITTPRCKEPDEPFRIEGNASALAAALLRGSLLRVIHEDTTHRPRRYGEEVHAVLPLYRPGRGEPQIRLVYERGGVERVVGALTPQASTREPAELLAYTRKQLVERLRIAITPTAQVASDVVFRAW